MTHHIQGTFSQIISYYFYDNFMGLNVQSSYIQKAKRKKNEGDDGLA